ncbi:MAG: S1C family serine protease [Oscillospiraceae bacterium]
MRDSNDYNVFFDKKSEVIFSPKKSRSKKYSGLALLISAALILSVIFFAFLMAECIGSENDIVTSFAETEKTSEDSSAYLNEYANAAQVFDIWEKKTLTVPEIVKKAKPSVVGIISEFPDGTKCTGTGIIMNENGCIVTNAHVIQNISDSGVICAEKIQTVFSDKSEHNAEIIGADIPSDLAVIKIESEGVQLFPAEFGDSDSLVEGETAVAIGNPLGLELYGSTTCGIISALGRTITVSGYEMTLIQTDAAINPGNSGGPLLNCRGEVIGINSSKIISDNAEGLGFAIPISDAKPIIERLIGEN